MKINRYIFIEIILTIVIIILALSNIENTALIETLILICFIVVILLTFINAFIKKRKDKKLYQYILENIPPKKGVIVDFLIYKTIGTLSKHEPPVYVYPGGTRINSVRYYIFPIIKDLETQKTYVTILKHNYSKYKTKWQAHLNSPLEFRLLRSNGTNINIGDTVNMYINKEIGNFNINFENDYLKFENVNYKYTGKNDESFLIKQNYSNTLINVESNDFLNLLKDTIVFEGIVDIENTPITNK